MTERPEFDAQAQVRLFGGPELEVGGNLVKLSPFQRCVVALVFADSPEGISRVRAAEILWDEPVGAKQRHRLSSMINKINDRTGVQVIVGDEEWLQAGSGIRDRPAGAGSAEDLRGRGAFLSRCTKSPSNSFEEWKIGKVERITALLREHFEVELTRAREAGEWEQLDAVVQVLAGIDEGATNYQDLADISSAILSARPSKPSGPRQHAPTLSEVSEIFVGRESEVRKLVAGVVTRTGGFSLSLVTGVAGIGKTTVLKEVERRVAQTKTRVIRGSCSEPESNIMLGPLISLIASEKVAEHIALLDSPWREVVLSLIPDRAPSESRAALPYIDPKQIPVRLYEALRRLFESLCRERPLLLIIDNYEWHDSTTHAALTFIATHWGSGRLHVALASRTADKDIEQMLKVLAEEQVPTDQLHLLELSPDSAAELVLGVMPSIDGDTLRHLCHAASGHPLFLVELAREVADGSDLKPETPLPPSIGEIVIARLARLQKDDRRLLSLIAVLARPATLTELSAVGRRDLLSTAESASRLAALHLVSESQGRVDVRHDLTRRALYSELSSTSRALLHRSIAEGLEAESAENPAELAHHFAGAGMVDRALPYAIQAAAHAETTGGVGEAVRFLKLARRLGSDESEDTILLGRLAGLEYLHGDPSETIPLLELAASRLKAAGDVAGSIRARVHRVDLLRELDGWSLNDLYKELGSEKDQARECEEWEELANALHIQIRIAQVAADREEGGRLLTEVREFLEIPGINRRAQCRALCALGHQILLGDPEEGAESARQALDIAETDQLTDLLFAANLIRATALIVRCRIDTEEGKRVLVRCHELAGASGDLARRRNLLLNQGAWCLDCGRLTEARQHLDRVMEEVRGPMRTDAKALLHLNLGELELLSDNYADAEEHFRVVESCVGDSEISLRHRWTLISNAGLGLCALRNGRMGEANQRLAASPPLEEVSLSDPTLLAKFQSAMLAHRGKIPDGAILLATASERIAYRFPLQALRIQLEEVRLLRRFDLPAAQARATEGALRARTMGVHSHAETFLMLARA